MVEIEKKKKPTPPRQPFRRDGASEQSRPESASSGLRTEWMLHQEDTSLLGVLPTHFCLQSAQALYTQGQPWPAGQPWLLKTLQDNLGVYWEVQAQAPGNQATLWVEGIAAGQLGLELGCSPCGKIELGLRRTRSLINVIPLGSCTRFQPLGYVEVYLLDITEARPTVAIVTEVHFLRPSP